MNPTVYAYSDPRLFMRDVLAHKRKQNPLFSLRAWARQMGFRCHSSLVFLLNGDRKIRPEHVERINKGLKLAGDEASYFRTLIEMTGAQNETERAFYETRLKVLEPTKSESLLEVERFRSISDWVHMAILEMTILSDFDSSPAWIARRLGFDVTEESAREAIARLMQLGLLELKEGRLVKTHARLSTPKDRAAECIREHHRQVLANATRAIEEQSVEERVLNSCTFTVDTSKIEQAKELILKFRSDMAKLLETEHGNETYQMSVQLFKLTRKIEDPA